MKYFGLFASLLLMLWIGFSGCKNQEDQPKDITIKFLKAIQEADYNTAKKFATKDSKDMLDALASFQEMLPDESQERFKQGKITVLDSQIKDSLAIVYYNSDQDTTRKSLNLKKKDGKWRVAFTKKAVLPNLNEPLPKQDSIPTNKDPLPTIP